MQCAERVRELARAGAQVIKFTATGGVLSQQARGLEAHFTDEEMRAIVATAHSLGLRVAAHAHGARGIEAAARAGVDSIEHGTFADARRDRRDARASSTALVPTLMAFTGIREGLAQNRYTPPVAAKVARDADPSSARRRGRPARRACRSCSAPMPASTSMAATPRNSRMLVELVGMSPAEAIAVGDHRRRPPARPRKRDRPDRAGLFGRPDRGRGDPLADVRALEQVEFAMVRGRIAE